MATYLPAVRGQRWVPPAPGMMPRLISGCPKRAVSPATIRSHISASSQPPPSAYPLTAAIRGFVNAAMRAQRPVWSRWSCSTGPRSDMSPMSAPAANTRGPPVRTTARTSWSASKRSSAALSSSISAGLSAFRTRGRLSVTTPTAPWRSTSTCSYCMLAIIGDVKTHLRDSYGRVADDLRISVTDRCNFRCVYCMPAEGLRWLAREDILRFEEIHRLARLFVQRFGVRTIRLTGGEPLVRHRIEELVAMINDLDPTLDITMTTNGVLLRQKARLLAEAGLKRVNVSLDTLHLDRFKEIARVEAFARTMDGIRAAEAAGLRPIKLNMVVMKGT